MEQEPRLGQLTRAADHAIDHDGVLDRPADLALVYRPTR
jgi:hypothetical protein